MGVGGSESRSMLSWSLRREGVVERQREAAGAGREDRVAVKGVVVQRWREARAVHCGVARARGRRVFASEAMVLWLGRMYVHVRGESGGEERWRGLGRGRVYIDHDSNKILLEVHMQIVEPHLDAVADVVPCA